MMMMMLKSQVSLARINETAKLKSPAFASYNQISRKSNWTGQIRADSSGRPLTSRFVHAASDGP